ncbi:MAG: hypothetical protein ABSE43_02595 [Steroidobacteraceae bacterium]|jgi:hypothetical protein
MPISTQEAAEALQDIAQTQHRASNLRGYERGSPHLILWGLIWVLGYGTCYLAPTLANLTWLVLDIAGIAGSFLIGRAAARIKSVASTGYGSRFAALGITIFAFIAATYYILQPHDSAQFGAFPALFVALIYSVIGIWRGSRWAIVGIALGLCTVAGYAFLKEYFMLWMAVVGGGTLIMTGFWLRRA